MSKIITVGEILVDLVSTEKPQSGSWGFIANAGGAPANVAVGVAKLGAEAGFVGTVGKDAFGDFLRSTLTAYGVDCQFLMSHANPTTLAIVALNERGDRSFSFYRNETADTQIPVSQAAKSYLGQAEIVHFGAVSLADPQARQFVFELVDSVKGPLISFDPNYRPTLWESEDEARRVILEGISRSDIVKLSEEELEFLTGGTSVESARSLMEGRRLLAITKGEHGCFVMDSLGNRIEVPAFDVTVRDTTGAGDAFVAGMLTAIAEQPRCLFGDPVRLRRAVEFASAAAALSVGRYGAIPSLPSLEEVRREYPSAAL